MASAPQTVIREILSMSPTTGAVENWRVRILDGKPQVEARSAFVVRFKVDGCAFLASPKAWRARKACGFVEALAVG